MKCEAVKCFFVAHSSRTGTAISISVILSQFLIFLRAEPVVIKFFDWFRKELKVELKLDTEMFSVRFRFIEHGDLGGR